MTDKIEMHVALRNAEHRNRRLQERLEDALLSVGKRAALLTELRRAANVRTDVELLDHVRNISVRGVILPTPSAELAAAQAAHHGAEAEVAALREWQELHSADVRSIRTEMEEVEEQRAEAYAELSALRQALSVLYAFTAGKTVLIAMSDDWPTVYRPDTGVNERLCPHGIGHPIRPDHPVDDGWGVHSCDGCCAATPTPTTLDGDTP